MIWELLAGLAPVGAGGATLTIFYNQHRRDWSRELHAMERQRAEAEKRLDELSRGIGRLEAVQPVSVALGAVQDTIWMDVVGIPLDLWMEVRTTEDLDILRARRDAGRFKAKLEPPVVPAALVGAPEAPTPQLIQGADEQYVFGTSKNGQGWRIRREPTVIFQGNVEIKTWQKLVDDARETIWLKSEIRDLGDALLRVQYDQQQVIERPR